MANLSVSRIPYFERKSFVQDGVGGGGQTMTKFSILELHDAPAPELKTCWELLKGVIIMSFCVFCLTVSGIIVKYHYGYNPRVTIYDMVFTRAFSQLIVSWVIAYRNQVDLTDMTQDQWKLVIVRACSGTMTFFVFNIAVKLISLSKVAFLNNTSPLFATIIAFLFLGEAITKPELISLSLCIVGVAILV